MAKSIWQWLEIEPTTDKNAIKAAYAEAAKKYHPSEHPEEFQELRRCYKAAISQADLKTVAEEKEIRESSEEETKTYEEENLFPPFSDEAKENNPFTSFWRESENDNLSERQRIMLTFFSQMGELMSLKTSKYKTARAFELIFEGWNHSFYADEITPEFTHLLLEIISNIAGLEYKAYDVFEKAIICGRKTGEWTGVYSRFLSMKSEAGRLIDKSKKGDCYALFSECSGKKDLRLSIGYITPYGLGKFLCKKDFLCDSRILIDLKKGFKKYLWKDLGWTLNPKNDELRVIDCTGKEIIVLSPDHYRYTSLLCILKDSEAHYLGEVEFDKITLVTKMLPDPDGRVRVCSNPHFTNSLKRNFKEQIIYSIIWIICFVIFTNLAIYGREFKDAGKMIPYCLSFAGVILIIFPTFLFFMASFIKGFLVLLHVYVIYFRMAKHRTSFKRNILEGYCYRTVGGNVFFMNDYLIMKSPLDIGMLKFENISRATIIPGLPGSRKRTLQIVQKIGRPFSLKIYDKGWPDALCARIKNTIHNVFGTKILGEEHDSWY